MNKWFDVENHIRTLIPAELLKDLKIGLFRDVFCISLPDTRFGRQIYNELSNHTSFILHDETVRLTWQLVPAV